MTVHSMHYLIGANLFDPSSVLLLKPIKLEIMNTTKMSQLNMLSEGSPDSRVQSLPVDHTGTNFERSKRVVILGTVLIHEAGPCH